MAQVSNEWLKHQRRRWRRHDAHRFMRPDAYERWRRAHGDSQESKSALNSSFAREAEAIRLELAELREIATLRRDLAAIKADVHWPQILHAIKANFNHLQPRDEDGKWTADGGGGRVRLAAGDKPRLGPGAMAIIAAEAAKKVIEAFRKENGLRDLFGERLGTVSHTTVNGEAIFGSNSTSPTYTSHDRAAAFNLRDSLVSKYPDVMDSDDPGRRPNDAVFHAETTALLRAARANGGTLAGLSLEVHSDRVLCPSCNIVLPYVGLELGNPTVTFVDPRGKSRTMRDGTWK